MHKKKKITYLKSLKNNVRKVQGIGCFLKKKTIDTHYLFIRQLVCGSDCSIVNTYLNRKSNIVYVYGCE